MKVALTPHQEKFIASKMKSGGLLTAALRHSLRSPLK